MEGAEVITKEELLKIINKWSPVEDEPEDLAEAIMERLE